MKKRKYDIPLVYNLKQYTDYKVFAAIKFYCSLANSRIMTLFYRFIRGLERRSKGEWVCKVEGDNVLVQRHVHALIGGGMKTDVAADLKQLCIDKHEYLKREGKKQQSKRHENNEIDLIPFADSTVSFTEYDPNLGAEWYIGKKSRFEKAELRGMGLDSVGDSNWKISSRMKDKIRKKNEIY
jgi:hypothetical protein